MITDNITTYTKRTVKFILIFIHYVIVAWCLLGWSYCSTNKCHTFHILSNICVILQWLILNVCILTKIIDEYLKEDYENSEKNSEAFTSKMWKFFGINIESENQIVFLNSILMGISSIVSLYKIFY